MTDPLDPADLPEIEVPWFCTREHYAAIVGLLKASGYEASVFFNMTVMGVQVASISDEGSRDTVVWANLDDHWAFSIVDQKNDGRLRSLKTTTPASVDAITVARMIMEQDYSHAA